MNASLFQQEARNQEISERLPRWGEPHTLRERVMIEIQELIHRDRAEPQTQ